MYCNLTNFQSSHYHSGPTRKFACSLYEILPDNCTTLCDLIIRTVPALFLNLHELRFSNSHLYTFSRLQMLQTCSCRCRLAGTVPVAPLSVWWRWSWVRYELPRTVGLLRPFFGIPLHTDTGRKRKREIIPLMGRDTQTHYTQTQAENE